MPDSIEAHRVKEGLRAGKQQVGVGWSQFRSPAVARILAAAGFDRTFTDPEHGGFDIETAQDICFVAALAGITPVVRVAAIEYSLITRALDCDAQGIILPRVESADLLRQAVGWTKFPPPIFYPALGARIVRQTRSKKPQTLARWGVRCLTYV